MSNYKPLTPENIQDDKVFHNFTYNEFACHCKGKYCDGFPVDFSYELARNLQVIRTHFGKPLHITSPIRCEKWNTIQGGVKNSKHKLGWACDFYVDNISYDTLANFVETQLPFFHYCYRITGNVIHYDITPQEEDIIIQPTTRDEKRKQLKVLGENMIVRRGASKGSQARGYVYTDAIYNYQSTTQNEGYTWYQIDDIQWIADSGGYVEVLPIKEEDNMEELQKQLEEAQQKIRDLEAQIIKLNNDLGKYKVIYNCDKTDYYKFKIKMYENESLYIKEGI